MAAQGKQNIVTVCAYAGIIATTCWLSGKMMAGKTIYDRYIISFEGNVLTTSDAQQAKSFYMDVLDFTPIVRGDGLESTLVGFSFPGKRSMFVGLRPDIPAQSSKILLPQTSVLRVRNGFDALHSLIVARSGNPAVPLSPQNYERALDVMTANRISEVVTFPWGKEFIAKDFDGNRLIFYSPRRILGSRYQ